MHLEFASLPDHPSSQLFYSFIQPSSFPIGYPAPLLYGGNHGIYSLIQAHTFSQPSLHPVCSGLLISCPLLSSPPNHSFPYSLQTQDIQYLKWNRMNIKWVALGPVSLYYHHFSLALSSLALSIRPLQQLHDKEWYELHQPCRWVLLPLP